MFLSVVPGLGHLYKGYRGLAVLALGGAMLAAFAAFVAATATMGLALIFIPIYWGAVAVHAYWLDDRGEKKAQREISA
jgi:hypothetical protein